MSKLTQAKLREVLDYNAITGEFRWRVAKARWLPAGSIAGTPHGGGYVMIGIDQTRYLSHRLAWLWVHSKWPKAQIDHRDGNRRNNAIDNLREATPSQNCANGGARKHCKTGVRGVYMHKPSGRFRVQLGKDGRSQHIGYFDTIADASAAAKLAAQKIHGDYASR